MNLLFQRIKTLAHQQHQEAIHIRRHIHQHPELSFEEKETSAYISSRLTEWGIPHQLQVAGYGIVGLIEGKNPQSRCIALRADMDALPIREQTGKSYCSRNEGVMHACGHDAHTAILLATAHVLNSLRNEFEGSIKLLFQHAEEKLPGVL